MSLPDGLNKVKLGYGAFPLASIQQDAGGNIVRLDSTTYMPIQGDYFYSTDNTNGTSSFVRVTSIETTKTFRINITSGSGTVHGGYFSKVKEINVYHSDNENIIIAGKKKTRIDKTILENIIGYKPVLNIVTEPLSLAEKKFMYQFAQSDVQRAEVFSNLYSDVILQDSELTMDLIENYILAVGVTIELHGRNYTTSNSTDYDLGSTDSSGYKVTAPLGTRLKLTMNWGGGDISRNFCCNLANIYSIAIERQEWEHLDESAGRTTMGFRPMVQIDFGTFGYSATAQDICDDIAWLKNFVLAPSKYIDVYEVFQANITNDFDEIRVDYVDGFVFAKTLSLSFVGKSLQQNQVDGTGVFTLDDDTLGILDSDSQLG